MSIWDIFWRYGWLCSLLVSGLVLWINWSLARQYVTHAFFSAYSKGQDERFRAVEARQAEQELVQKQILTALSSLPTVTDLHRVEVSLTGIDGAVKASQAEVRGIASGLNRIERVVDILTESHMGANK